MPKIKQPKPKFKKNQVVFIDDLGFYGRIMEVLDFEEGEWQYLVLQSPCPTDRSYWTEAGLRSLTTEEISGELTL